MAIHMTPTYYLNCPCGWENYSLTHSSSRNKLRMCLLTIRSIPSRTHSRFVLYCACCHMGIAHLSLYATLPRQSDVCTYILYPIISSGALLKNCGIRCTDISIQTCWIPRGGALAAASKPAHYLHQPHPLASPRSNRRTSSLTRRRRCIVPSNGSYIEPNSMIKPGNPILPGT